MTHRDASRTPPGLAQLIRVVGLLVVVAGAVALGTTQQVSSSPTAAPPASTSGGAIASPVSSPATAVLPAAVRPGSQPGQPGVAPSDALPRGHGAALGVADGVLPSRTAVFDDGLPGIARLDAALLHALHRASTEAKRRGVRLYVDSGWRSRKYQQQLFGQAVSDYGSEAEAARWVAAPGTSAHESGDAVDIGPSDAITWLSSHGAEYGLCQIYRNEPWHYELRPGAIDGGCPRMYADPTQDPRMQP